MVFVSPFIKSDDEDNNTVKPKRRFSDVFNTFVNSVCVKKCI